VAPAIELMAVALTPEIGRNAPVAEWRGVDDFFRAFRMDIAGHPARLIQTGNGQPTNLRGQREDAESRG
jgi:hypothetical protein